MSALTHELMVFVFIERIFQGEPEIAWEQYKTAVRLLFVGGGMACMCVHFVCCGRAMLML